MQASDDTADLEPTSYAASATSLLSFRSSVLGPVGIGQSLVVLCQQGPLLAPELLEGLLEAQDRPRRLVHLDSLHGERLAVEGPIAGLLLELQPRRAPLLL